MRVRFLAVGLVALFLASAGTAHAQKKKKKPKKPKTQQEAPPEAQPPPPPPINTELKETESSTPGGETNPWVASGSAKRKNGGGAPEFEATASDRGGERRTTKSTWVSRPLLVGAYGGYATSSLRIGFGARAGYSINDTIYIGGALTYHLGVSVDNTTISGIYPGAEVGYDYHIEGITLRPYAGLGLFFLHASGPTVSETSSAYFTLYPGIAVDYQIPSTPAFVGLDTRVLLIFGEGTPGATLGVFAMGGARF